MRPTPGNITHFPQNLKGWALSCRHAWYHYKVIERPQNSGRGAEKPRANEAASLGDIVREMRERADDENALARALRKHSKVHD